MAKTASQMDDATLASFLNSEIDDAVSYDIEDRQKGRLRALEYMRGYMPDTPADAGWSSVTTSELADVVGWMMPGLMRVFASGGNIVEYAPSRPEDEPGAAQATDYVNYVFASECDGYRTLWGGIYDALLTGNGILKYWWDDAVYSEAEWLKNLTEEQIALVLSDDDVEVIGHSDGEPGADDAGQAPTVNLKIRRVEEHGRLKIAAVPPEEFLIDRRSTAVESARFVCHRQMRTRSDLVAMGYDRGLVDQIPHGTTINEDLTQQARGNLVNVMPVADSANHAMQMVEVFECYPLVDYDGDGIAERRRVLVAGASGNRRILENEEWTEKPPFADLVAVPVAHAWKGRSIADDVADLQRVSTVLVRHTLDNLYLTNRPQRGVDAAKIENPDEVLSPRIGGVIRTRGNPREAIADLVVPFSAEASLGVLQYVQNVLQRRTGVSQAAPILDEATLQPQTATATQIQHDAGYAKVELIARNFAEIGLKSLFRGILRLVVANQDRPRTIRLRNNWVNIDPRGWNASMDANINVGLGTGSRERDLKALQFVAAQQDMVVKEMGPGNPIVSPDKWIKTRQKMVEAAGLKEADQYFSDVPPEQMAQFLAQKNSAPDPRIEAAKMKAEVDRFKAEKAVETDRLKLQGQFALKEQEMQLEAQLRGAEIVSDAHAKAVAPRDLTNIPTQVRQ